MSICRIFPWLYCAIPLIAQVPEPVMVPGEFADGTVSMHPMTAVSGQFGTWKIRFRVGTGGIQQGGGIRVQLPDSWHSGPRNSALRLQATEPAKPHYVSARSDAPQIKLTCRVESEVANELVKHAKPSLDGRNERYVFVVRVVVEDGRLEEGDGIELVYGDTTSGSPGMLGGAVSTLPEPVLTAVDKEGSGRFRLLLTGPVVQIKPGPPAELRLHLPSQALVGSPFEAKLSLIDAQNNPVDSGHEIDLETGTGSASIRDSIRLHPGPGFTIFPVTADFEGVLRLKARVRGSEISTVSNPCLVSEKWPERRLYWGDLHSHARDSWDGVGDNSFSYARNISGLDFYALTDHSNAPENGMTRGLSLKTRDRYNAMTESANLPNEFVTLHAYEASFGRPFGHHIVYFRDKPGPLVYPGKTGLDALWTQLREGDALTIPHHTGKFPGGIDFEIHDPRFRRNFEIYSGHGLSESFDPRHPLSFENSEFTSPAMSLRAPTFAVDTWKRGLQLSVIASSDDHRAQPGQPHYGLAAVRAGELNRDGIFQALHDRRTYGTSGAKVILDFSCNGASMGRTVRWSGNPRFEINCHGTDLISKVELLRLLPMRETFEVIQRWEPMALDFGTNHSDLTGIPGAIYYLRLQQKNLVRGKAVMAWSSPIWTVE